MSMIARRSPRRPMTASISAEPPAIASCAFRTTSSHVFSIQAMRVPSTTSGHLFAAIHAVASLTAASNSSAANDMANSFTLSDAESRLLAHVTGSRTDVALMLHSAVGSESMMFEMGGPEFHPRPTDAGRPPKGRSDPGPHNLPTNTVGRFLRHP